MSFFKRLGDAFVSAKTHGKALWPFAVSVLLVILCLVVSNWFLHSAVTSCKVMKGQSGGAIAVLIAIFFIFLTPSYASRLHKRLSNKSPNSMPMDSSVLLDALGEDAKFARFQNALFAVATFVGTLYWAFGDQFAQKIMDILCVCKTK